MDISKTLPDNERMKTLLKDLAENKMTMDELDKECAYWYISYYDILHPLPKIKKPIILEEYDTLNPEDKGKMSDKFWRQEIVMQYFKESTKVNNHNNSTLFNLKKFIHYIPEGDTITREKFKTLIREYEGTPFGLEKAKSFFGGTFVESSQNEVDI